MRAFYKTKVKAKESTDRKWDVMECLFCENWSENGDTLHREKVDVLHNTPINPLMQT